MSWTLVRLHRVKHVAKLFRRARLPNCIDRFISEQINVEFEFKSRNHLKPNDFDCKIIFLWPKSLTFIAQTMSIKVALLRGIYMCLKSHYLYILLLLYMWECLQFMCMWLFRTIRKQEYNKHILHVAYVRFTLVFVSVSVLVAIHKHNAYIVHWNAPIFVLCVFDIVPFLYTRRKKKKKHFIQIKAT